MREGIIKRVEEYESQLIKEFGYLKYNLDPFDKSSLYNFLISFFQHDTLSKWENGSILEGQSCHSEKGYYPTSCGKARSGGDLFLIAKYHYSNEVKLIDVMSELYKILEEEIQIPTLKDSEYTYYMNTYICPDINKRVFWIHFSSGYKGRYKFTKNATSMSYNSSNEVIFSNQDYIDLFAKEPVEAIELG